MDDIPSPPMYRLFQKVAIVAGIVTTIAGFAIQNSAVWGAGLVILFHALIATIIITVEDRRKASTNPENHIAQK